MLLTVCTEGKNAFGIYAGKHWHKCTSLMTWPDYRIMFQEANPATPQTSKMEYFGTRLDSL